MTYTVNVIPAIVNPPMYGVLTVPAISFSAPLIVRVYSGPTSFYINAFSTTPIGKALTYNVYLGSLEINQYTNTAPFTFDASTMTVTVQSNSAVAAESLTGQYNLTVVATMSDGKTKNLVE